MEWIPYLYLSLIVPAVKKKARPFSAGAVLAFALTYPLGAERYALMALSVLILALGYPYENQPVKFWERFVNAVIGGTGLAIALGLYNLGSIEAVLGVAVPFLLLRNRVISSFGLLPASALYLIGAYQVSEKVKLALFALVYVYSLNHLRKLLR
ncbi:hypothetical protein [Thermococcus henrietii]|uniref:hypothetical protein n=1 Tax=Thermococcus henrietii TaxID=2016361 RepID=UPI000C08CA3D|nr:hypothetical protein [Thermococcus henrietii]